jgi:GntR family histidine utilization transcriptional repressor
VTTESKELKLSGNQSIPMYQQVKDAISQKIAIGEWQPGQMIPSENQLSESLGMSRMTINRPLRELTAEGLLRRVHGLGTFVAEPARRAHLIELVSIAQEIQQQGKEHKAAVLSQEIVNADLAMSERMQLVVGAKLFKVELVHYQDGVPIQLETRVVNPSLVPGFIDIDFTNMTTTDYLISQISPEELEHVVQAIMPDNFIAKQLDITMNEPCLKLRRRTWKNSQVVTSVDLIYPSSRYDLGDRYSPSS